MPNRRIKDLGRYWARAVNFSDTRDPTLRIDQHRLHAPQVGTGKHAELAPRGENPFSRIEILAGVNADLEFAAVDLRTRACFQISRRLLGSPAQRTVDYASYGAWREESLSRSWSNFSDEHIVEKEVLDFGCGDGQLALFLARTRRPHSITGIDMNPAAIARALASRDEARIENVHIDFRVGSVDDIPMPDRTFDTILAFDCMEHVMQPLAIIQEWHRVLKPGGRCLIEWFPFKGPWGPHMESLIRVPWAHVVFGERAMFETAAMIYDLPEFAPRHWDLDDSGRKRPNKWRQWSSFAEQGYINQLDIPTFADTVTQVGFRIARMDKRSFGGSWVRRAIAGVLMRAPLIGEHFVSHVLIELERR